MNLNKISKGLLIVLPMLALGACSSTNQMDSQSAEQEVSAQITPSITPSIQTDTIEVVTPMTAQQKMVQKYGQDILKNTIHFDFDKSTINTAFAPILNAHAAYLKDHTDKSIMVEGYADEKGTPEYNIALGERRAMSVAAYLENTGVNASQINTTSYGEEKPVNSEHNPAAWLENRRAELVF